MAHKVHPKVYRIKDISGWNSRGFYRNPAHELEEDFRIREFLYKKLEKAAVEKIEIERFAGRVNIIISSARPGLIIGRGGEAIEELKKELARMILKRVGRRVTGQKKEKADKNVKKVVAKKSAPALAERNSGAEEKEIRIEIREIKNPWISSALSAQWVAQQIEKRVAYRRVLKQAIGKISQNKEVKGVKVEISGRLSGSEIARREWLKEGKLPLQTIRADIDYGKAEAFCTYGVVGVKVWIYKGEKFD